GDLVQPGSQRRALLDEPADALPGGQHRLLDGVFGLLEGSEHPVAVHLQLPPVGLGQLPERLSIPCPRPREQIGCHHPALPPFRTASWLRPVYTPPGGRTGRLAAAQFPDAAVYASPTARTIRSPDRAQFPLPGRPRKPPHELPEPDPAADAAAAVDVVI